MSDGSCTKTDSVMDMKKEDTKSSKETGEKNENEEEEIGEIFLRLWNMFKPFYYLTSACYAIGENLMDGIFRYWSEWSRGGGSSGKNTICFQE